MSKILALDASTEVCSVAVGDGSQVTSRFCDIPKSHSKMLLPLIDEVLTEANLTLADLDAIAVTRGPGSFTGIRIGLGIVQGLSYGANIPIVGLSTLEALAETARQNGLCEHDGIIVPCLDARMGEVYSSVYRPAVDDSSWLALVAASVGAPEKLAALLLEQFAGNSIVAVGHGWHVAPLNDLSVLALDAELKPQATAVLTLAQQYFALAGHVVAEESSVFPVGSIEPIYLRNEITWQKRQRIRQ